MLGIEYYEYRIIISNVLMNIFLLIVYSAVCSPLLVRYSVIIIISLCTHTQRLWLSRPCRVYFTDSTILSKGINLCDEHRHHSPGTVIALFPLQAKGSSQCLVLTVRSSIPSMT